MDQDPRGGLVAPLRTGTIRVGGGQDPGTVSTPPHDQPSGIPQACPKLWVRLLEENSLPGALRGPLCTWAQFCEARSQTGPSMECDPPVPQHWALQEPGATLKRRL